MSASTSRAWLDHYSEWTPHTLDYGNKTIVDYYRDNLRVNANKPATYFFGRTQTYAELDAQVRAAAIRPPSVSMSPSTRSRRAISSANQLAGMVPLPSLRWRKTRDTVRA